jgi:hypothetical protein
MEEPSEEQLIAGLRQIAHAIDYGRPQPQLAPGIAGILMKLGLIVPTGLVGFRLTDKGRDVLRIINEEEKPK